MEVSQLVFIGTSSTVAALDKATGHTVWQTQLGSSLAGQSFVTLCCEGERIYAHSNGELYCLDAQSGKCFWKNGLKGLGYGLASVTVQGKTLDQTLATIQQLILNQRSADSTPATPSA
jgi:glucose dehydrogenase